jgi:hypothetical protein
MPRVLNVDIVVDTQDLLALHPEPSQDAEAPTRVEAGACYLIAPPALIERGQASAHLRLTVAAPPTADAPSDEDGDGDGDAQTPPAGVVQWRTFSLSGNAGQSAVLYAVAPVGGGALPNLAVATEVPAPRPTLDGARNTDPPSFDVASVPDYYIETPILGEGLERLSLSFYVTETDRENGRPRLVGYFAWTSALTVRFA